METLNSVDVFMSLVVVGPGRCPKNWDQKVEPTENGVSVEALGVDTQT